MIQRDALLLLAAFAACPVGSITGPVTHVRDGDTIVVGTMPVRLQGLAAPETSEPGGAAATRAMTALVAGRQVRCEIDGTRSHDRCVGVCYYLDEDIAAVLVRQGLARDCPRYSGGRYAGDEASAATIARTYALPGYCRLR